MAAEWDGSGLIWARRYLFLGLGDKSDPHQTHATIICVALDGHKRFKLRTEGAHGEKSYRAAIIGPNVKHAKMCREAGLITLLYLTPETNEAYQIKNKYLHGGGIAGVPKNVVDALLPQLAKYPLDEYHQFYKDCGQAKAFCETLLQALGISPSTELSGELEPDIKTAIDVMSEKIVDSTSPLKVDDIVREVTRRRKKKPSDLPGQFIDQVDTTLTHYKAGLRLREAFKKINPKVKIRRLARQLGWSGGSAFSNDCYAWLGVRPSEISNYSYFDSCEE
jgi:AraC-like DNA-binding protein